MIKTALLFAGQGAQAVGMGKEELGHWQKLAAQARKLEATMKSAKLSRASQVYAAASAVPGELLLYLLLNSSQRLVQDRIRNYLQKYLLFAMEITDRDVEAQGLVPGTPKFNKRKMEMIAARLDGRQRKPVPATPAPEEHAVVMGRFRR